MVASWHDEPDNAVADVRRAVLELQPHAAPEAARYERASTLAEQNPHDESALDNYRSAHQELKQSIGAPAKPAGDVETALRAIESGNPSKQHFGVLHKALEPQPFDLDAYNKALEQFRAEHQDDISIRQMVERHSEREQEQQRQDRERNWLNEQKRYQEHKIGLDILYRHSREQILRQHFPGWDSDMAKRSRDSSLRKRVHDVILNEGSHRALKGDALEARLREVRERLEAEDWFYGRN